ncbi:CoA pyrophosphatase [Microbispora sp. H10949]|uniref:NUDIX hydrolase n=1 Tax=Microbispora sp. H10949 TaxID=2729111 RepID=UPI00287327AA|nr:CoA pyrophosphatase [Microbispora sp. H10949]
MPGRPDDVEVVVVEVVAAPDWLTRLAAKAAHSPVPTALRPPANGAGRSAAVLLLFGEGPQGPDILLIQRSSKGRVHAGQPAFPGGGVDPDDDGPVGAALREAGEETGLDPAGVEVVGTMPELYIWHSDNRVTPVLGWWHTPCAVHAASPDEVETVERVPIEELVDPANRLRLRHPRGVVPSVAFRVRGLLVWGFTAGVLDGVLTAAGFERPWDRSRIEDLPPEVVDLAARG